MARWLVQWAIVGLVLAAGGAEAQQEPTASVTVLDPPETAVATNDTVFIELFTVTLRISRLLCTEPTTFPVQLSVEATMNATGNRTATYAFRDDQLEFVVDDESFTQPYEEDEEALLEVRPGQVVTGQFEVPVRITAFLEPGNRGCQGAGTLATASDTAEFVVSFGSPPGPSPTPTGPQMPGPGFLAWVGAIFLAGWAFRKRLL